MRKPSRFGGAVPVSRSRQKARLAPEAIARYLATLLEHLPRIQPKRLVLTHMSDEMLQRAPDLPYETARDGLVVADAIRDPRF